MERIKDFFVKFAETRKITYYIALGAAVLSFIMGIVATATLAVAGATALPLVLTLLGLLAFLGLSVIGQEKAGAGLVAFASFMSVIAIACEVYEYFLAEVSNQAMGAGFNIFAVEGFSALLACVILLIVCAIVANVMAWLKLGKEEKIAEAAAEEVKNEN